MGTGRLVTEHLTTVHPVIANSTQQEPLSAASNRQMRDLAHMYQNSHQKLLPTDQGELLTSTHNRLSDMIMENWSHWGRQIGSWAGNYLKQTEGQTEFRFSGGLNCYHLYSPSLGEGKQNKNLNLIYFTFFFTLM